MLPIFLLFIVCLPLSAFAASFTTYTDRAAFDAAAGSYTLLTLDAPDAFSFVSDTSYFHDGVCVPGVCSYGGNLLHATVTDYNCGCNLYSAISTANMTTISSNHAVTAFGFDIMTSMLDPSAMNLSTGTSGWNLPVNGLAFFGLVSADPFNVWLSGDTAPFSIDNVAMQLVAGSASVPEPSAALLALLGLILVTAYHRQCPTIRTP